MVSVPAYVQLVTTGGAQRWNVGDNINVSNNPGENTNHMYGQANRRTLISILPLDARTVAGVVYERVPITITADKTAVTVYALVEDGSVKTEVFNSSDVSQGSVTLTSATSTFETGNITGLSPAAGDYVTITLIDVAGGTEKLHFLQVYEMALTSI